MADYCDKPTVLTLSLGANTVDLMNDQLGFRVSEVDLGYPDVREDSDLRPDQRGVIDYTRLFGARAVTISGFVISSPYGSRQAVLHAIAPFMDPAARPVLTYQIDADVAPRTMTLRPSALSVPFNDPNVSDFSFGWKAVDPAAYGPTQTAYAIAGAAQPGRAYNLTFPRTYPAGGSGLAVVTNNGDLISYPVMRLYGPATYPAIQTTIGGLNATWTSFNMNLGAGSYILIDSFARTALLNGDPSNSVYSNIQFTPNYPVWPYLPPGQAVVFILSASGTSTSTQLQINYSDAFLL